MNVISTIRRDEMDQLLAEHLELIRLANDAEYQLYRLGAQAESEEVLACQKAVGALIGRLRETLFSYDQQVFPALETLVWESDVGK